MAKKVLLIGGNFFPEPTGIGKYNGEMTDWLSENGYSCTVITTYPYYPFWRVQDPYKKSCLWFKKEVRKVSDSSLPIHIIRVPHYVPKNPSGIKRIISDFSFFFTSYLIILNFLFKNKHDYVMSVAPPFQIGLLAILYKKIKGAKFVYHIQDLQIDAARDLNMIKSVFVLRILFSIEKFILKNADTISTISTGMAKKVAFKCNKEIKLFPNWVDTNRFFPINEKRNLKTQFGFNSNDIIVLYSGAIGEKQGLEAILYSAKNLQYLKELKFVICGSGPYKEKLETLKQQLQLKNVIFYPLQPLNKFNEFINIADIHLVLQKANASDLVMPSKLSTILSVGGLAIVSANPGTSLHDIISKWNMGILIEPEKQECLDMAIKNTITNYDSRIGNNAKCYAEKNLSIDQILTRYTKEVFKDSILTAPKIETQLFESKV